MIHTQQHKFHIPVMGLGFTIDTPYRVAHFGIGSAVSVMEDHLLERMRQILSEKEGVPFSPLPDNTADRRAARALSRSCAAVGPNCVGAAPGAAGATGRFNSSRVRSTRRMAIVTARR